jgi:hypothetical protein
MLSETKGILLVSFFTELPEELSELVLFDLLAVVLGLCELLPDIKESSLISLELGNHVIIRKIIFLKLLDNNQNEKIEHDMSADKYKHAMEEYREYPGSTSLAFNAASSTLLKRLSTAIKHDPIPILSSRESK